MNRFLSKIFTIGLMIGSVVMTSCLKTEEDNGDRTGYGYFTVTGDDILGYQGYYDAGGVVKSLKTTDMSKLKSVERAFMVIEYNTKDYKDLSDGTFVINSATIQSADIIPVNDPMYMQQAQDLNVMSPDSCASIEKVGSVWAKKGYLNVDVVTYFGIVNGKSVQPKVNFVVLNNEETPDNTLNLMFCFNNNVNNNSSSMALGESIRSLNISNLRSVVTGNDSVNVNVTFKGIKDPVKIKMGRNDFDKPTFVM